jgi:hypothetical protein
MTPQETITALPQVAAKRGSQSMESLTATFWGRLLVPSLSDLFFIAMITWLFLSSGAAGWQGLLEDADVGWHIRTGQYILDHKTVPHQDLYSFSKAGAPWYAWEWLADVLDGSLHRWGGLKAIVLTYGALIALFCTTLLRRVVRTGATLFAVLIGSMLAVGAASVHFLARPHVFTLLFLSISMWLIETDRSKPSPRLWLLVPLSLLWTNVHGGFLVLVAVLGLAAVGAVIEAFLQRRDTGGGMNWQPGLRYGALAAACFAVSFINPYGWGLHQHVIAYLRSDWIKNAIQEFQSPTFRSENMLQFEALMFMGLITAGAYLRRRRFTEALWIVFFAYLALSSARHVPIFATVTVPLIAMEMTSWWDSLCAGAGKKSILGILNNMAQDIMAGFHRTTVWPVVFLLILALPATPIVWPMDFPDKIFPVKMVHAHEQEILHARLLTTDQWGDYLIYLHPEIKVFVDGRSDFYGPEIGDQYIHLSSGTWDWQKIMTKYNFDLVLFPVDGPLPQLLKLQADWRVVDDDGKRILLARQFRAVPTPKVTQ